MPPSSLPHGPSFLPVPSARVTIFSTGANRRVLPVGWLGVVCASPPVLTVCLHRQAAKRQQFRVGELFAVELPAEETIRAPIDARWLNQAGSLAVSGQPSLPSVAGEGRREPPTAVSPVRIDCRCRSLGVRFGQYWLSGEIVAIDLDGYCQEMTAAVDLCHLLLLQRLHFHRIGEGLRHQEGC